MTPRALQLVHAVMRMSARHDAANAAYEQATTDEERTRHLRAGTRRYKATIRLSRALANTGGAK